MRRRWPQFRLPAGYEALWEPVAGLLRPETAVSVQAEQAMRHGAELHGLEPVTAWDTSPGGVVVRTARASYAAARVVFCGGPWTNRLVADLGVHLSVRRQAMGWVWPRRPDGFALGALPTWLIDHDGGACYGFPMLPDNVGLKVASHTPGPPVDPDVDPRRPLPEDEETFRAVLHQHIPQADGPLLAMRVCLYTMSPDSHFIVDRHPLHAGVVIACGFSGHGFKFAPVIGEALADLAQHGGTPLPIGFLGLSRFQQPRAH